MDIPNSHRHIQHRERIFSAPGTNILIAVEPGRTDSEQAPVPKTYDPDDPF
jgi:hypothetical protein